MKFWLKNNHGNPSASLTFYTIAFGVVCFAIVVSILKHIEIAGVKIEFSEPNSELLLGFFMLAGSGYVYRSTKGDSMAHKERLAALKVNAKEKEQKTE